MQTSQHKVLQILNFQRRLTALVFETQQDSQTLLNWIAAMRCMIYRLERLAVVQQRAEELNHCEVLPDRGAIAPLSDHDSRSDHAA